MSRGTVRYWAAARAAAGTDEEVYDAGTVAEALDAARERHGARLTQVLARCSYLVDGTAVAAADHARTTLAEGGVLDVLPPFAGG